MDVVGHARWISVFAFFDPSGAVANGLSARDVVVLLGVFAATTAAAFIELDRQDL